MAGILDSIKTFISNTGSNIRRDLQTVGSYVGYQRNKINNAPLPQSLKRSARAVEGIVNRVVRPADKALKPVRNIPVVGDTLFYGERVGERAGQSIITGSQQLFGQRESEPIPFMGYTPPKELAGGFNFAMAALDLVPTPTNVVGNLSFDVLHTNLNRIPGFKDSVASSALALGGSILAGGKINRSLGLEQTKAAAKGFDFGRSPMNAKWHPEDVDLLDDVADKIFQNKKNITPQLIDEIDRDVTNLIQGYLPKEKVELILNKYRGRDGRYPDVERLRDLVKELQKTASDATGSGYGNIQLGLVDEATATVSPEMQPLLKEAKKYKSAEEFVRATNPNNKNILPNERPVIYKGDIEGITPNIKSYKKEGNLEFYNEKGNGIYVKVDGEDAGFLTKLSDDEVDLSVAKEFQRQGIGKKLVREFLEKYPEMLYKTGGFTPAGEATYRSQLTDIWAQANKSTGNAAKMSDLGLGFVSGKAATGNVTDPLLRQATTTLEPGQSVLAQIRKDFEAGEAALKAEKRTTWTEFYQAARSQLVDRLSGVYDFVEMGGKKIAAEDNPYVKMRLMAGISGKIEQFVSDNLQPIIVKESDRLEDLDALLLLDREMELISNGYERRRTITDINLGMQELLAKHGEEGLETLRESAREWRGVMENIGETLRDAGIISDEGWAAMREKHQMYVPFEAVEYIADNLEKGNYARSSFNVATQDVIKKIGDYEGAIASPMQSSLRKISKSLMLAEKNAAMKSLVDLRELDPDTFGDLIRPLKSGADPDKGFGTINVFINGENQRFAVPDFLEGAIKNLDAQQANILTQAIKPQTALLRAGAVIYNIGFIPFNLARDFQDALITTAGEKGAKGVYNFLAAYPSAVWSAFKRDDLYQEWIRQGGGSSTFTNQIFKNSGKTIRQIAGKNTAKDMIVKVAASPKRLLEYFSESAETATRLARVKAGLNTGETITEAVYKGRDVSIDFAKAGSTVKTLNQVIPFLNAQIQGSEKILRMFKDNPAQASLYATTMFAVPAATLYAHNRQFQDYADVPQSEKDEYWIVITKDRTEAERANGDKVHGFKIPKGFIAKLAANFMESSLQFVEQRDPKSLANFLLETTEGLSPVGLPIDRQRTGQTLSKVLPPALKAPAQVLSNRDFYFDSPIVPRRLEGVAPEQQYKERTSEAAKFLGATFGLSPLMIESVISTTTGGLGRQALQLASGDVKEATVGQLTRRTIGVRSGAEVDEEFDQVAAIAEKSKTATLERTREAEKIYAEIKDAPREEAVAKLKEVAGRDEKLAEKILDIRKDDKAGVNSLDRYIKSLPVQDGSRAEYIWSRIQDKPKEEQKQLLKEFAQKKILTEDVLRQVLELRQQ